LANFQRIKIDFVSRLSFSGQVS